MLRANPCTTLDNVFINLCSYLNSAVLVAEIAQNLAKELFYKNKDGYFNYLDRVIKLAIFTDPGKAARKYFS